MVHCGESGIDGIRREIGFVDLQVGNNGDRCGDLRWSRRCRKDRLVICGELVSLQLREEEGSVAVQSSFFLYGVTCGKQVVNIQDGS